MRTKIDGTLFGMGLIFLIFFQNLLNWRTDVTWLSKGLRIFGIAILFVLIAASFGGAFGDETCSKKK